MGRLTKDSVLVDLSLLIKEWWRQGLKGGLRTRQKGDRNVENEDLVQGSVNYGLWAEFNVLLIRVHEVLLEYRAAYSFSICSPWLLSYYN